MNILKTVEVPTGHILVVQGEKGKLECLSLADYGKDVNVKADFLGLERELDVVKHTTLMPLTKKWVITISTQYGCSSKCQFCDVPKVGSGRNATLNDLLNQVEVGMSLHPEITTSERLNIHYARMGEPTWNDNVLQATVRLKDKLSSKFVIHPVISTMMPKANEKLEEFLSYWIFIKNQILEGEAGLQLSINSTNDVERNRIFGGSALSLKAISEMMDDFSGRPLVGRKYTLNFAVADWEINPSVLANLFDPAKFIVKLTPMHKTTAATKNSIATPGDYTNYYSYQKIEEGLKAVGFDVLVFVASDEEDSSRITCGNAILADEV